ncbi:MAG: histidine phosphatase family protein [Gammaproteobacteria bacterium]|nr:histidine phosphatase family protein [Gammaproteobacteria bacterium]
MLNRTRAIVIRHYKTLFNETRKIMGWRDAPGAEGWMEDAKWIEEVLWERVGSLDAVCSSSLERARNTAMHFAARFGVSDVAHSDALREVNYGALYGKTKRWVTENIPQHKNDPDFVYPDGESFRQMQERSVRYFRSLSRRYPGQTVLVVVHAGVIRGLVSEFAGLDYADNLKRKVSHQYIGVFRLRDDQCVRYDELGKPSGFVRENVLELPVTLPTPRDAPATKCDKKTRLPLYPFGGFVPF